MSSLDALALIEAIQKNPRIGEEIISSNPTIACKSIEILIEQFKELHKELKAKEIAEHKEEIAEHEEDFMDDTCASAPVKRRMSSKPPNEILVDLLIKKFHKPAQVDDDDATPSRS